MPKPDQPTFADNTPANSADSLDGEVLGEKPGDNRLPGLNDFTDRTILNSEDPAVIMGGSETRDDLKTRAWREVPEDVDMTEVSGSRLNELTPNDGLGPTLADDEKSLVADQHHAFEPSSEEAAIQVEPR